jgi:Signal transduction histidine kinase regulating C4-dicarboxylate transport system
VAEGEYVVLTVSDTGKGIPASELKNIFEPFYTKKSMGEAGRVWDWLLSREPFRITMVT